MDVVLLGVGIAITCTVSYGIGVARERKRAWRRLDAYDFDIQIELTNSPETRGTLFTERGTEFGVLTGHEFRNWQQVQIFNSYKQGKASTHG